MSANIFLPRDEYCESQLQQIMQHVLDCHNLMITDAISVVNNENKIRNRLIKNYLMNQKVKNKVGITDFRFFPEVAVIDENDDEIGYTDIHVVLGGHHFNNDDAVFILECKRLDGKGDLGKDNLNGKYINNGVMRFISEQYPSYFRLNGMVGFCVEPFDIQENTLNKLNQHLNKWCSDVTIAPIVQEIFIEDFEHTFTSVHRTTSSQKDFKLYHLMLDTSPLHEIKA
jgi:hypothetical protein